MKVKKLFKRLIIVLVSALTVIALGVGIFLMSYQPSLTLDFSKKTGKVKGGASGYLYGISESEIPTNEMAESLGVKTVIQKVNGGLQHPVGDIDKAVQELPDTKYNIVYLQDVYDSWYYLEDDIMTQRKEGSYDYNSLLESDYFPRVAAAVKELSAKPYTKKVVYCPYNECDNGVWFGETKSASDPENKYGVYAEYNNEGRDNFNDAWKKVFELIKSVNPNALIAGPNYSAFDKDNMEYFLSFCKENGCVPDIIAYHELNEKSIYFFSEHISEYREIEKNLGLDELEIIVTEYGKTDDSGLPGQMVKYISCIENSKIYGDNAFWRLADNFNDNCADATSPNSQWWLMHWYSRMSGKTVKGVYSDIWNSDFKNSIRDKKALNYQGFMGIGSISDDEKRIDIICGGNDKSSKVVLKNLNKTKLAGKPVEITIEQTVYKGIFGICSESTTIKKYAEKADSKMKILLENPDRANAYHITIKVADESSLPAYENDFLPVRYEFEEGKLLGKAYKYDSYCPATSNKDSNEDMVGGLEKEGDGVEIKIDIPEDGLYNLDFVYGKANDGEADENGRQNPNDRKNATAELTVGKEKEKITLENTLKSEYTSCYSIQKELEKGEHKIVLKHKKGTFVLDSLVVSAAKGEDESNSIAVLKDDVRSKSGIKAFIAVAPDDGYYSVTTSSNARTIIVSETEIKTNEISAATVYLKRGVNFIDVKSDKNCEITVAPSDTEQPYELKPENAALTGGAIIKTGAENAKYIDGISSSGGAAQYRFNAPSAGKYMFTVSYSNNEELTGHDYNVDLIERYITVSTDSIKKNVYCRNTYSFDTQRTVTFDLDLHQGENVINITNSGENRFNNNPTFAPYIYNITVNPIQI